MICCKARDWCHLEWARILRFGMLRVTCRRCPMGFPPSEAPSYRSVLLPRCIDNRLHTRGRSFQAGIPGHKAALGRLCREGRSPRRWNTGGCRRRNFRHCKCDPLGILQPGTAGTCVVPRFGCRLCRHSLRGARRESRIEVDIAQRRIRRWDRVAWRCTRRKSHQNIHGPRTEPSRCNRYRCQCSRSRPCLPQHIAPWCRRVRARLAGTDPECRLGAPRSPGWWCRGLLRWWSRRIRAGRTRRLQRLGAERSETCLTSIPPDCLGVSRHTRTRRCESLFW